MAYQFRPNLFFITIQDAMTGRVVYKNRTTYNHSIEEISRVVHTSRDYSKHLFNRALNRGVSSYSYYYNIMIEPA